MLDYQVILDEQIQILKDLNTKLEAEDAVKNARRIRENANAITQLIREQRIAIYHENKDNGAHLEESIAD